VLTSLEEHLHDYDAMDQLEILCANSLVDQANCLGRREMIAERLNQLPPCTAIRLRALGIPGVEQISMPGY
jgi:hypothetical protein